MTNEEKLAFIKENYLFARTFELVPDKEQIFKKWTISIRNRIP